MQSEADVKRDADIGVDRSGSTGRGRRIEGVRNFSFIVA